MSDLVALDPNIALGSLLVAIPATIGAIAALRNGRKTSQLSDEVRSTNGTSTGETIQQLKEHALINSKRIDSLHGTAEQVIRNQVIHEELDKARQEATNARITIMDLRISQNDDHMYAQDRTALAEIGAQKEERARVITVAKDLATHAAAAAVIHEDHLDSQDITLDEIQTTQNLSTADD